MTMRRHIAERLFGGGCPACREQRDHTSEEWKHHPFHKADEMRDSQWTREPQRTPSTPSRWKGTARQALREKARDSRESQHPTIVVDL